VVARVLGSGGEAGLPGELVGGAGVGAGGGCQASVACRGGGQAGDAGAQEPVMQAVADAGIVPGDESGSLTTR